MIVVDLETLDFFSDPHIKSLPRHEQIEAMRFGCAVTYKEGDGYHQWATNELGSLLLYLSEDSILCNWNIVEFDIHVLNHNAQRHDFHFAPSQFRLVDLFDEIRLRTGRWCKLNDVARLTLGRGKTGDGQTAAELLRQGETQKALDYCQNDVVLTKDLQELWDANEPITLPAIPKRNYHNKIRIWKDGGEEDLGIPTVVSSGAF